LKTAQEEYSAQARWIITFFPSDMVRCTVYSSHLIKNVEEKKIFLRPHFDVVMKIL